MDEVKLTGISALQAARKFNMPARTLYDKLKKSDAKDSRKGNIQNFPCRAQIPVVFGENAESIHVNYNRSSETETVESSDFEAKMQEKIEEYVSGSPVDSGISSNGTEDTPAQIDETMEIPANLPRTEGDAQSLSEALANSSLEPSTSRVENFLISQRRDNTSGGGIIQNFEESVKSEQDFKNDNFE